MDTKDKRIAHFNWCAKIQFPGKTEIYVGTLFLEVNKTDTEVRAAFKEEFDKYLPDTYDIINMIRGTIRFVPAKENV